MEYLKSLKFANHVVGYDNGWILSDGIQGETTAGVLVQSSLNNNTGDVNWSADLEEAHEESTSKSWIDIYERDRVIEALSTLLEGNSGKRIIEFGSSTGYMIQDIKMHFPGNELIATDLYAEGLHKSYRRNPDIRHIQCDNTDAPFADESMDVFVSLNVLEHIEDDEKAIAECYRILKVHGGGSLWFQEGIPSMTIMMKHCITNGAMRMENFAENVKRQVLR